MSNWLQELYTADKQEKDNQQGQDKPYSVYIDSVSPDSEKVVVRNWATRGRELSISHPFLSAGSWIRALPEVGAQYMATSRSDDSEPQLLSSFGKNTELRINAYRARIGNFRSLSPGEIEISSSGIAQAYYASRAFNSTRAGLLLRTMNQDDLTIMDRSPIHTKQFLNYKAGELGDEHRVGIVSRPKNTWKNIYPKLNDKFLAEEFLSLVNPSLSSPKILFAIQRGHVVDKKGTVIKQRKTSLPLRSVQKFYATDDTFTTFEIDQSGNYFIQLAQAASDGFQIEVPNGNFRQKIKKDLTYTVDGNRELILRGSDSEDISGAKKILVAKAYSLKALSITEDSTSAYSVTTMSYKLQAKATYDITSIGPMTLNSTAIANFVGTAGTNIGSPASITNVLGKFVNLGGGGLPVARIGDVSVGLGNLGFPVVSLIITGSAKVTSI